MLISSRIFWICSFSSSFSWLCLFSMFSISFWCCSFSVAIISVVSVGVGVSNLRNGMAFSSYSFL